MRDGQVSVHLPLNLNTDKAWVGQGTSEWLRIKESSRMCDVRTRARWHCRRAKVFSVAPVSCGPPTKE